MELLPDEVLLRIFDHLSWNDAFRLGATCGHYREVMYDIIKCIPETAFVTASVLEKLTRLEIINLERQEMAQKWLQRYTHLVTLICDTAPIPHVNTLSALPKLRYIKKRGEASQHHFAYCNSRGITLTVVSPQVRTVDADPFDYSRNRMSRQLHYIFDTPHGEYHTGQPDFGS